MFSSGRICGSPGMAQKTVELTISPAEFFREHVSTAIGKQKLEVSADIEFYLVNLLCEFIDPQRSQVLRGKENILETPLALQFKKALEAPPEHQAGILRGLGDTSLYVAGYFQDFFNKKVYDVSYFVSLGSQAYSSLSFLLQERDDSFASTYRTLGQSFTDLVEVVAEISDTLGTSESSNILAIYDRWTRNQGSVRLRRKLEETGIVPIPISTKIAQ
jgi:hypothetical protein